MSLVRVLFSMTTEMFAYCNITDVTPCVHDVIPVWNAQIMLLQSGPLFVSQT